MPAISPTRAMRRTSARAAFSLIELLVVMALMAMLAALVVPALPGLLGVGGRQGGVNIMSVALEQARLAAMESGGNAYVGFPLAATNTDAAYSSVLVFRDATEEERQAGNTNLKPVTKWLRLPRGIYWEAGDGFTNGATNLTGIPTGALPKLGGESLTEIVAVPFDRFGKLRRGSSSVTILVGEKPFPTAAFARGDNMHGELTIQPLTGRVKVTDAAGPPPP